MNNLFFCVGVGACLDIWDLTIFLYANFETGMFTNILQGDGDDILPLIFLGDTCLYYNNFV